MGDKIEHLECASCKTKLTRLQKGDIVHNTHFDIYRSYKTFDFNSREGTFEEDLRERNVKMHRILCEQCFLKILTESPTLGNLFLSKDRNGNIIPKRFTY